jgi:UDP-glucose 4-epimerase
MNVAVVGGSGFVGRHVVRRFASMGGSVVNLDRRNPPALARGEHLISLDLRADRSPEEAAARCPLPVDAVVWLAGVPNRRPSAVDESALDDLAVMVEAPLRYLAALDPAPSSFVYASSIQVYGLPRYLPVDETHPTDPVSSYGIAKLCGESFLDIACRAREVPLAILRFSFVYGPGQNAENAIPRFVDAVRKNQPPRVHGSGGHVRDDVYVGDVARAIEIAVWRRAEGVFNVAGGRPRTILEVAETVCRVSGKPLRPLRVAETGVWTDRWFAVDRARRELGFEAATTLEEGLSAMLAEDRLA